jgi:aryl-alcohol dehydrogenase-like predicted oxidoreductase
MLRALEHPDGHLGRDASVRYVEACGLRVSVIGLGAWQFGSPEWGWGTQFGPAEALAVVERARALGITLIDTAELYGHGESERLLGRALADPAARDQVVLASKVTPTWPTRDRVAAAARGSLARLGTDRLDLYQVHWPNPLVAQRSTMAGMRTLQAGGLVGQVGVSNYGLGRWRAAESALGGPVVSNQVRYSLLTRRPERRLLPHAAAADRLIVAYSPLAQGVLAARYTADTAPGGARARNLLFSAQNLHRAEPVLQALRELAAAHQATPAQVALAWVVHHPNVVAIPGARSVAQVEANAAAADLRLAPDELAHLTAAADRFHRELVRSAGTRAGRRLRSATRAAAGPPGSPGRDGS